MLVKTLLYGLLVAGIFLSLMRPMLFLLIRGRLEVGNLVQKCRVSPPYRHFRRLLVAVNVPEHKIKSRTEQIFILMLGLFLLTFVWLQSVNLHTLAFPVSIFTAAVPYGFLRASLETTRYKSSHEGEHMLSELLNQYKLNHCNIIEAVDETIRALDEASVSKRALFRLSLQLKICRPEEVREALDDYCFAMGTTWAKMLANNIYMAIDQNLVITAGLEDILKTCRTISSSLEESKRENMESFAMVKFLAPAMYILLLIVAVFSLGLTPSDIIGYQLRSSTGVLLMIGILGSAAVNVLGVRLLSRQKWDL